jgi:hypothetical protein
VLEEFVLDLMHAMLYLHYCWVHDACLLSKIHTAWTASVIGLTEQEIITILNS